jgi:uncharacterized lipoprotein YddW (UPF0748 family)
MRRRALLASAAALAACSSTPPPPPPALPLRASPELLEQAPPAPREFRAAWVATVANIDWPSQPGLTAAQQQAEMHALLDRAAALNLNALILQVRSSADALYESALEPWSEYLSGVQGQSPGYDPLALWIAEAHKRGLELHAWFNPFRARQSSARSAPAASHLSQTQPQWVKRYGDQLWIDPGEPDAAAHTLAVVADVLQRYEVDGIHIDDYFYPYPIPSGEPAAKQELDFPDEPSWQRYLNGAPTPASTPTSPRGGEVALGNGPAGNLGGGKLARADWRRRNVDTLVERLFELARASKPWVRVGISPFGLGKPALRPEGIAGFSQYDKLYADVERWLAQGWLDYLLPQLYWPMAQKPQAFAVLLDYWHAQNPQQRHVWAGLFTSKITDKADSWPVAEIQAQIDWVRQHQPGSGHAHFSMAALSQNRRGLADALAVSAYAAPALPPACPWLEAGTPAAPLPSLVVEADTQQLRLSLRPGPGKPVARYALWLRQDQGWQFRVVNAGNGGHNSELLLPRAGLSGLVVSALDRVGNEGPRVGLALP